MAKIISKNDERIRRHKRIRRKISGTKECPRLSVFRSNKNITAQIIDDSNGTTLAYVCSNGLKLTNGGNVEAAKTVGGEIAKKAKALKIEKVVFDRGGYIYHGRIKAVAEAARAEGLKF